MVKLRLFFVIQVMFLPSVTGGYSFTIKEVSGNYASQVFSVLMMKTGHVLALRCSVVWSV